MLNPLEHPILFTLPRRAGEGSDWLGCTPAAMLIVELARPETLVELGTTDGVSYCALCQAVDELGLDTRCRGIGSLGAGGAELRADHDPRYGSFSELEDIAPDPGLRHLEDESVDLLHLHGPGLSRRARESWRWLPKLSSRGVALLYGIHKPERAGGLLGVWEGLRRRHRTFELLHGPGLGVVAVGKEATGLDPLTGLPEGLAVSVRHLFAALGVASNGDARRGPPLLERALSRLDEAERRRKRMEEQRDYWRALAGQYQALADGVLTSRTWRALAPWRKLRDAMARGRRA